jgi:hypothetical protein
MLTLLDRSLHAAGQWLAEFDAWRRRASGR